MRIGAQAAMTHWRERGVLLQEFAVLIEELLRPVAFHPVLELLEVLGLAELRDRHLVRTPGALDRLAVHESGSRLAFGRDNHDHGPTRALDACEARGGTPGGLDTSTL